MKSTLTIVLLVFLCSCGNGGGGGGSGYSPRTSASQETISHEEMKEIKEKAAALLLLWEELPWMADSSEYRRGIEFGWLTAARYPEMSFREAELILTNFIEAKNNFQEPDFEKLARKILKEIR